MIKCAEIVMWVLMISKQEAQLLLW